MTRIRSEAHQFCFKPRYNNDKDIELTKQLEELQEHLELKKSELVRKALYDFVKYNKRRER
tara:strand:+ start:67 stop:249 length:183 start_codon:yes stop_codon:yes gene_type:complete